MLIALSPTAATRVGSVGLHGARALLLFTVSAVYHRGTWSPRTWAFLQRFDHANIFLLIAGSYTPFTLLLLEGSARASTLLAVAWGGALAGRRASGCCGTARRAGSTSRSTSRSAGRRSSSSTTSSPAASTAVFVLIAAGGLLYTVGGVVYGLQRPNPFPSWFGFHEVFHAFTILAFVTHYVGVSLATYSLR